MGKHLRTGVIAASLAMTFLLIFFISLDVKTIGAQIGSDNVFDFTSGTSDAPTTSYLLTDERETTPPSTSGSVTVALADVYWSTNKYDPSGCTADTRDGATWNIVLYYSTGVKPPDGTPTVNIEIRDSTFALLDSCTAQTVTLAAYTTGSTTFDFTGTWSTKQELYNLNDKFLVVHWSGFAGNKKFDLRYGPGQQTVMNTGYVIPEEFLAFLPTAVAIPFFVGKWVNRRKKRKRKLSAQG